MGREIKRVPLDFDWPRGKAWAGFFCPYSSEQCPDCGGCGYGPDARRLHEDWYDFARTGRRWCDAITEDEVDALIESNRLYDFTHTWSRESGWQRRADGYRPSADEVNAWQRGRGIGHDAINAHVCLEARCKRLGYALTCERCEGEGVVWESRALKRLHDEWESTFPPEGEGWQVWETVSEGSPISPVFATAEELAKHLSTVGDDWHAQSVAEGRESLRGLPTYEQALAFIGAEWAPSMVIGNGKALTSYEVASEMKAEG